MIAGFDKKFQLKWTNLPIVSPEVLDCMFRSSKTFLAACFSICCRPEEMCLPIFGPEKNGMRGPCPDPVNQTFLGGSHRKWEKKREVHQKICNDGHALRVAAKGHQIPQDPLSQSYKGDQDENQLPFPASGFWSVYSC